MCGVELTDENWAPSVREYNSHICKRCSTERSRQWRKANPEKHKTQWTRCSRKQGYQPFNENKKCPLYLGVHVAEDVLSRVFKNIQRMPMNNQGFDFMCGKGYKIDVKSSCFTKNGVWHFTINHNQIADYFLCLAFDSREDLNPLPLWLIPGGMLNHLAGTSIGKSTIHKWDAYKLDIDKVTACCNVMKGTEHKT